MVRLMAIAKERDKQLQQRDSNSTAIVAAMQRAGRLAESHSNAATTSNGAHWLEENAEHASC